MAVRLREERAVRSLRLPGGAPRDLRDAVKYLRKSSGGTADRERLLGVAGRMRQTMERASNVKLRLKFWKGLQRTVDRRVGLSAACILCSQRPFAFLRQAVAGDESCRCAERCVGLTAVPWGVTWGP